MNGYEARLAAFADGRRLLRLRHPVPNDAAMACDACGSAEPRWLHLLKDEATGRYALVGSNCVRALTELGAVRRRYAPDVAAQAYADELAYRQAVQRASSPDGAYRQLEPTAPTVPRPAGVGVGARLVAAVAVLHQEEWAALLQTLPLGAGRWRFLALDGEAAGLEDLVVIGVNGNATGAAIAAQNTTAPSRPPP